MHVFGALSGHHLPCCHVSSHTPSRAGVVICAAKVSGKGKGKGDQGRSGGPSSSGGKGSGGFAGGASSGKRAGASGDGGGKSKPSTSSVKAPAAAPLGYITGAIQVELQEELSNTEFTEAPRWETWCNHVSGEWVGVYGAYTPWAGLPEPVWMDERRKYLDTVLTRCLEETGSGPVTDNDMLLRRLGRANTPQQLKELVMSSPHSRQEQPPADSGNENDESSAGDVSPSVADSDEDSVEVEALHYNRDGVVVFSGGIYSAGPDYIGPPQFKILQEDPEEEGEGQRAAGPEDPEGNEGGEGTTSAPGTISIVESCLVDWSSRLRMRLKITLRISHKSDNDEVDVEVLRILLFREVWAGAATMTTDNDIDTALKKLAHLPTQPTTPTPTSPLTTLATVSQGKPKPRPTLNPAPAPTGSAAQLAAAAARAPAITSTTADAADAAGAGGACAGSDATSSGPVQSNAPLDAPPPPPLVDPSQVAMARVKEALRSAELLPRGNPDMFDGSWKVFSVSATAIEENDLMTGETLVTWVYQTNEDVQEWNIPKGIPTGDEGGAVWLPGGVVVSFSMQDYSTSPASSDGGEQAPSNGAAQASSGLKPPRGLRLGMSWALPVGGQVMSVERDYDGKGVLRGVRYSTAVKDGWAGGRM